MKKNNVLLTVLIIGIVFLSYSVIFEGFFQQDEWLSFAYRIVAHDKGILSVIADSFTPSVGHYQPLNSLVINILYHTFKINYLPYAIISITLHLINVFLVFKFSKKVFSSYLAGILISLFFGISPTIYQATSWVMADLGVHFSTLFAIICLSKLYDFFNNPIKSNLINSLIFLLISIFFKEISIGIFGLIFLIIFFVKSDKKSNLIIISTIVFTTYLSLRIIMIFMPVSYQRDTLFSEKLNVPVALYNVITLPAKSLVQSIIPARLIVHESYVLAKLLPIKLTGEINTPSYDMFVQKKVLEFANLINLVILSSIIYFVYKDSSKKNKNIILLSLTFIVFNSPIFALAPERIGRLFIIDSRNLYLICISSSIIIYLIINYIYQKQNKLGIIFTALFILFNLIFLNQDLKTISNFGEIRKNILYKIYFHYPKLSKNTIFYTQSDSSYFGLSEEKKILPFQSGLGQTLLVWYYDVENYPTKFYSDRFLWEIDDQGYKEFNGKGFGYFRDYDLFAKALNDNNLDENSVIAFKWISKENRLIDITKEIKKDLNDQINK